MLKGFQELIQRKKALMMDTLSFEVLKSEIVRTRILFRFFFAASIVVGVVYFLIGARMTKEVGVRLPFEAIVLTGLGISLYEFIVYKVFQLYQKKRKVVFPPARFVNAFVEISFVTLLLWLNINSFDSPLIPLYSPAPYIYFIFIILSVLRLEFSLSVFTGLIAGVELFALAFVYIPASQTKFELQFFNSFMPFFGKGVLLLMGGVVSGFVAVQLKRTLISATDAVQEKNKVVGMFGQYVSPEVVDRLLEQKSENFSEFKHVCVMFLDIRNFTRFSEKRSPGEVIDYLNYLFTHLIDIVNMHNGMINKFLGDGFMAVFGAPISDGANDIHNAVNASLSILKKVEQLNLEGKIPETNIGIGLHSGEAMTGNVGSEARKEYTIIGDVVNLASRVEQLNKEFQTKFLVTQAVFDNVKDKVPGRHLSSIHVKGREEPVDVYELAKL
ncbi:adenylate/guanylate cyclase domain-containing protein [Leptospira adleri]|uniref:Adenylate cyclase n=1 Tax=Leptospira adleri TaxID=2023186 RepID=A0A2M9YSW5_9LEPT|nr:adenylate/guanylate cyclase domain-containing protein [Leptospira adleri]PJZ54645.1 adenylate cyclase [Leptospira adleri]PJZ61540.1 adenylate cyclase [Leptospira adleri]TGM57047.1 adenylate/guanylate cyclase domain-containing protein [Leptospira adleri]